MESLLDPRENGPHGHVWETYAGFHKTSMGVMVELSLERTHPMRKGA